MKTFEGYMIKPCKESPTLHKISTEGKGGKIPNVLAGLFTSPTRAMDAITTYLDTKPKKE